MGRTRELRNLLADEIDDAITKIISEVNLELADDMSNKISAAARVLAKECFKLFVIIKPNEKAFRKKLVKQLANDEALKKKKNKTA